MINTNTLTKIKLFAAYLLTDKVTFSGDNIILTDKNNEGKLTSIKQYSKNTVGNFQLTEAINYIQKNNISKYILVYDLDNLIKLNKFTNDIKVQDIDYEILNNTVDKYSTYYIIDDKVDNFSVIPYKMYREEINHILKLIRKGEF